MECFNCKSQKSTCYYSPKELTKYNIFFCYKCIKLINNLDLNYFMNEEYAKKELTLYLKKHNVRK